LGSGDGLAGRLGVGGSEFEAVTWLGGGVRWVGGVGVRDWAGFGSGRLMGGRPAESRPGLAFWGA
jgi:hypothetical protein